MISRALFFTFYAFTHLACVNLHQPQLNQGAYTDGPSKIAYKWFLCPPKNPFNPSDSCTTECCSGSNWDLTCISFVKSVALKAKGIDDPDLLAGSRRDGQPYGSAVKAFDSMIASGRAHFDLNIPKDAAVFFSVDDFSPGHIAVSAGLRDSSNIPLIVSTGSPLHTGIRLEPLSKLAAQKNWHYLGWAAL